MGWSEVAALALPNAYQALEWEEFADGYPAWVKTAGQSALDTNFADPATNNSRGPIFQYTVGGAGDLVFSSAGVSPCLSGRADWLQCASNWGALTWNIYIRNLANDPYGWEWWDTTGSCPSGVTCWYGRRALIHEAEHVAIGIGNHDGQGETDTVMGSVLVSSPTSGWNQTKLRRCDQAAMQLAYDLDDFAGPYGDCFDHITGHGVNGLKTTATSSASSYCRSTGLSQSVSGRLFVTDEAGYGRLGDNPLEGRVLWFDRIADDGHVWSLNVTSATAVYATPPANNWTKSFSSPGGAGTWHYRAHFNGGQALDASNKPIFTITWSSSC